MIVSSFCLNDWDEEIMTSFCNFEIPTKMLGHAHNKRQRLKGSSRSENGSLAALGAFLKHKEFHLRQEIEPSPSVRHIHSLNSSLFSSDAKWAGTPSVFGRKTKLRFFTVSLQYHFKDCRGVLICKDTGVKRKKKKHSSYSAHTFPHLYQKSELLEVNCGGNV